MEVRFQAQCDVQRGAAVASDRTVERENRRRRWIVRKCAGFVIGVVFSGFFIGPALAQQSVLLVGNFAGGTDTNLQFGQGLDEKNLVQFSTGSHTQGYRVTQVQLKTGSTVTNVFTPEICRTGTTDLGVALLR